jgi:hypothetical protein
MHSRTCLVVLIVALATATGCGGGDGDDDATTDGSGAARTEAQEPDSRTIPLSRAEVIKQGDAICERADARQDAGLRGYAKRNPGDQASRAEREELISAVGLPPLQVEAEELADLLPPAEDAEKIQAIVAGIEAAVEAGEENPGRLMSSAGTPFADVGKLAREYGFKACATAG